MKYKNVEISIKNCPYLGYLETCTKRNCRSCWEIDKYCRYKNEQYKKAIKGNI